MAAIILEDFSKFLFEDIADPRTYHWPLMARPWYMIGIVSIYLFLVFSFLPFYMANKKPFNLRSILKVYNLFQVIACTVAIYAVFSAGASIEYLGCKGVDYSQNEMSLKMANIFWWVVILKIVELIETVFFLLRKKSNQVSELHVYHHTSTSIIAWLCAKYAPGGMSVFSLVINSFVHILMYSYYFLSSFGPSVQKKLQWVKPKITMVQLVQLSLIVIHIVQVLSPNCNIPNAFIMIYLPNMVMNIWFFVRFYRRTYLKKEK